MMTNRRIVVYTYYSEPWRQRSGDDIRIHFIVGALRRYLGLSAIAVYNLSLLPAKEGVVVEDDGRIMYISMPRYFYSFLAKTLGWKGHYDLNPLAKLTHYVDEFVASFKLKSLIKASDILYVFGSMSLLSFFIRLLGWKGTIIYDPLANYAQTLYLRSRSSIKGLLSYGLYLALHKLQLKHSDYVVYPSKLDLGNAERMFGVRKAAVVPNPVPVCFESHEEYERLRKMRKDDKRPRFVLLAGGRNKANEEAVRLTIEIFNDLPPQSFELHITGPWQSLQRLVRSSGIKIHGVVPHQKLKELLAIADYGLAPIFSHASGTFIKTLAYLAAGLHVITSLWGLLGVDRELLRGRRVLVVKNAKEYREVIRKVVEQKSIDWEFRTINRRPIMLCGDSTKGIEKSLRYLFETKQR